MREGTKMPMGESNKKVSRGTWSDGHVRTGEWLKFVSDLFPFLRVFAKHTRTLKVKWARNQVLGPDIPKILGARPEHPGLGPSLATGLHQKSSKNILLKTVFSFIYLTAISHCS